MPRSVRDYEKKGKRLLVVDCEATTIEGEILEHFSLAGPSSKRGSQSS
jgi:hypothetical protein